MENNYKWFAKSLFISGWTKKKNIYFLVNKSFHLNMLPWKRPRFSTFSVQKAGKSIGLCQQSWKLEPFFFHKNKYDVTDMSRNLLDRCPLESKFGKEKKKSQ